MALFCVFNSLAKVAIFVEFPHQSKSKYSITAKRARCNVASSKCEGKKYFFRLRAGKLLETILPHNYHGTV